MVVVTAPAATFPVAGRAREGAGVLPTVSPAQTHPGMAHTLAVWKPTAGSYHNQEITECNYWGVDFEVDFV